MDKENLADIKERQHNEDAIDAAIKIVRKQERRKQQGDRRSDHPWKLLFYDEFTGQNGIEQISLFDTQMGGYCLSFKGGGHDVVRKQFENKRELDDWFRKMARKIGYREWHTRKNGKAEFYI